MRVGLFISEFSDESVALMCTGADEAAKKLGIQLVIFPGKYIVTDKNDAKKPFDYQYQAVYDYSINAGFDGLVIDIDKIGKNAPILKKVDFIKSFKNENILTLTEIDGFESVKTEPKMSDEEQGFEAIKQIYEKISGKKADIEIGAEHKITPSVINEALYKIKNISEVLCSAAVEDDYDVVTEIFTENGIKNLELCILENSAQRFLKKGWKIPAKTKRIFSVSKGKTKNVIDEEPIDTKDIFKLIKNKDTVVIRNIFFRSEQKGFMLINFSKEFLSGVYDDLLVNILHSAGRIDYITKRMNYIEDELAECQEQLARDGSVLDHIGDMDYLTGLSNRRGFFAKAYDFLKDNFNEENYAVVAYIDMDSLKNINSVHGKDEGDKAVCKVAGILSDVFGKESVCGRIRGDEFAVILVTKEEDKAELLRTEMARQNNNLLLENTKYLNHLVYSICEFDYEENLSLREMLRETDENLKNMRRMEALSK